MKKVCSDLLFVMLLGFCFPLRSFVNTRVYSEPLFVEVAPYGFSLWSDFCLASLSHIFLQRILVSNSSKRNPQAEFQNNQCRCLKLGHQKTTNVAVLTILGYRFLIGAYFLIRIILCRYMHESTFREIE